MEADQEVLNDALVFGGTGRIGSAVAWDLACCGGADLVGIVGRNRESLQKRGIVVVEAAKRVAKDPAKPSKIGGT